MSIITCRNGFVFVAAIGLGLMVTPARGGSLDAPAGPESTNSAMYTLENVYNYLTTGVLASKRSGGFTEPTTGPTNGTMHTLNEIMEAGIIPPKTGQTNSYATGDDGALQIGVAWPNPRFTINNIPAAGTDVVTDKLTGLMWARNANLAGTMTWSNAIAYCEGSTYGGYSDWRLPNKRELYSLIDDGKYNPALPENHLFTNVQANYWSSTTYMNDTPYVWQMTSATGYLGVDLKTALFSVWPVRGGQ